MRSRLQFAGWLAALGMSAALAVPSFAQGSRANWAQNRQDNKPPKQQSQPPRQQSQPPRQQSPRQQPPRLQRQEQRQERRQQQQEARRPQNERQNSGANRPPNANTGRPSASDIDRAGMMAGQSNNPNPPTNAYTPPPKLDFNNLDLKEKPNVLDDNRHRQQLPPPQPTALRE